MFLRNIMPHHFRCLDSCLNHLFFLEIRIPPPSFEAIQALVDSTSQGVVDLVTDSLPLFECQFLVPRPSIRIFDV